ncbi:MAG: TonB C-terminal domain-containing protein [Vampirovibrio sp.]|nr:TonB C-terminal domain-containing protein [Vampirovibrio sp.]
MGIKNTNISRIKKNSQIIVLLFLVFNIFAYGTVLLKQTLFRPYPIAKVPYAIAITTNSTYIIPFSKFLGSNNFLLIPFKRVRDTLFDFAIDNMPEEDLETEMMWHSIYLIEYVDVYEAKAYKYYQSKSNINAEFYNDFIARSDEIYDHFLSYSTKYSMADKIKSKYRFNRFSDFFYGYIKLRPLIISQYSGDRKENINFQTSFFSNDAEVKKIKIALETYIEYIKKLEELNDKSYNDFMQGKYSHIIHYSALETASYIVLNKLISGQTSCSAKFLNSYLQSRDGITKETNSNPNISSKHVLHMQNALSWDKHKYLYNKINNSCFNGLLTKSEHINDDKSAESRYLQAYAQEVKNSIPKLPTSYCKKRKIHPVVQFTIQKNGFIKNLSFIKKSDNNELNTKILSMIKKSIPFSKLADIYPENELNIKIRFNNCD